MLADGPNDHRPGLPSSLARMADSGDVTASVVGKQFKRDEDHLAKHPHCPMQAPTAPGRSSRAAADSHGLEVRKVMTWNGKEITVRKYPMKDGKHVHLACLGGNLATAPVAFGVSESTAIAGLVQSLYDQSKEPMPLGYTLHPVMRDAFEGIFR